MMCQQVDVELESKGRWRVCQKGTVGCLVRFVLRDIVCNSIAPWIGFALGLIPSYPL